MDKKIKVYLIDDNKDFLDLCKDGLTDAGFEIIGCAGNGVVAFEEIMELSPDIVITDMIIPGIDGMGLIKKIRTASLSERPGIIALTCISNEDIMQEAMAIGANYYMLKPIELDILIDRISDIMASMEKVSRFSPTPIGSSNGMDLETCVTKAIHEIGVPAHIKGYQYLREAIMMSVEDMDIINYVTGTLRTKRK